MYTQLKQRIAIALVSFVCLLCTVTGANATVHDLGTISGINLIGDLHLGDSPFTDFWNFTLGSPSNLDAIVSSIPVPPVLGLDNLFLALFHADNTGIGSPVAGGSLATYTALSSGGYYFRVTADPTGAFGGLYLGAINVTAVPEPEVWAMMMIGVGLIGYQLRRKSKAGPVKIVA